MNNVIEFEVKCEKYQLREVGKNDLDWIYDLMTDQRVRERSFSQREFSKEENEAYWDKKLASKDFKARVILHGSKPVGLIRLDGKDVSIAIGPEYWGKSIAFNALKQLDLKGFEARVKPGNKASLNLFKKLGFSESHIVLVKE